MSEIKSRKKLKALGRKVQAKSICCNLTNKTRQGL
jgi:hypothetical protein